MTILERIEQDFSNALRGGDKKIVEILRLLKASLKNKEIELRSKKKKIEEDDIIEVLQKEAKKRKESIDAFKKGNRDDLLLKEQEELDIISKYLPAQLSEDDIRKAVQEIVKPLGELSEKDFGRVMGLAMKELKGKADGNIVSKLVKKFLTNK